MRTIHTVVDRHDLVAHRQRNRTRADRRWGCGYARKGNCGKEGCGSCERPARLWETAEKRSTQSLSRPGGSVKKKTQRSEFVFERRGEMVLIRSACIGNFLSSPSRDTEYERASLPSLPRLPDHSRRFVGWFIDLHVEGKFMSSSSVSRYEIENMPTIATTATVASEFEIGPELDPVWTQFSIVGNVEVCKCLSCLVDLEGFEPSTSSMPWKRAPNCATGPLRRDKTKITRSRPREALQKARQPLHALPERRGLAQQAHHQVRLGFEVVEEARLDQHIMIAQQRCHPLFFRARSRNLQHRVPAALDAQAARGGPGDLLAQRKKVTRRALPDLIAHRACRR